MLAAVAKPNCGVTRAISLRDLIEWSNIEGGEWYGLDDREKKKGGRWNYVYNGIHYVFQGLSLASEQAWCIS